MIGKVPEAFNDAFENLSAKAVFVPHPGGSGAMIASLEAGKVDAAFVLTDCAVAAASRGANVRLVAPVVSSPLVWGIVSATDNVPALDGTWAISRNGSGSDVMLRVWAKQRGVPSIKVKQYGKFDAMCAAVESGEACGFIWERSTTRGLLRNRGSKLKIVGQVVTPWPAFCSVTTADSVRLRDVRSVVRKFVEAASEWREKDDTVSKIVAKYGMTEAEATEWLKHVQFAGVKDDFDDVMLEQTRTALVDAGVIEADMRNDCIV